MAYLEKLHNEKMKAHYLARTYNYDEFHIYVNKEVKTPNFSGLKIRVSPIYRAMVEKLGGTAVTSTGPEVYTMLERNTVDGYGWPARGIFDFSWQKVTKYRIDPGFYNADIQFP
jgi:TRAP-type C4-dicarboxylate transport system substrate-binding protein